VTRVSGVTGLDHVLVLSDDLERSRRFYEDALGLRVGERPPLAFDGYWLYAGATPCLHLAHRQAYRAHARTLGLEVPDTGAGGGAVDHVAFSAAGHEQVTRRLRNCGVRAVANDVPGGGPRQLFVTDPDGVRVEINLPREDD
jgi:catechol 2,3-dioxygenase-like lactoylglutathione lyase family enzyme